MSLLALAVAGAYTAFGLTFRGQRERFWDRMTMTGLALGTLALVADRDAKRVRIGPSEAALGLASAAGLYALFRAGDTLARRVMPRGAAEIGDIYALRALHPRDELAARLALVIGPAEELFWRGLVYRRAGYLTTTALYGGAHLVTGRVEPGVAGFTLIPADPAWASTRALAVTLSAAGDARRVTSTIAPR